MSLGVLAGVGFFLCLGGGAVPTPAEPSQFASGINVVEVYATVNDAQGEPVAGLTAGEFVVSEDGERQVVSVFANADVPLAVAVALDRSFSISRDQLNRTVAAAAAFIRALQDGDQVMVLAVGSEIDLLAALSPDRSAAVASLKGIEPWGTTPLYDAARKALDMIHAAAGRRALILLSDGSDRYSDTTAADLIDHARRRNVLVYPVALGRTRPDVFAQLATVTGGRSALVSDLRQLPHVLDTIALELRSQYLLGYSPARTIGTESRWRSIGVSVTRPAVRVRARDGYFGP